MNMDYMIRCRSSNGDFREFTRLCDDIAQSTRFELQIPVNRDIEGYYDCYLFCVYDICIVRSEMEKTFTFDSMNCIDSASREISFVKGAAVAHRYLYTLQKKLGASGFNQHTCAHFIANTLDSLQYSDEAKKILLKGHADNLERFCSEVLGKRLNKLTDVMCAQNRVVLIEHSTPLNLDSLFDKAVETACAHLQRIRKNMDSIDDFNRHLCEHFIHYTFNALGYVYQNEYEAIECYCRNLGKAK